MNRTILHAFLATLALAEILPTEARSSGDVILNNTLPLNGATRNPRKRRQFLERNHVHLDARSRRAGSYHDLPRPPKHRPAPWSGATSALTFRTPVATMLLPC